LAAIIMHVFLLFLRVGVVNVVKERRRESAGRQRRDYARQASLGFDRRVPVAYPGEWVGFSVRINGPAGLPIL